MVAVFFALRAREGEVLDAVQKQLRRATKMRHGDALPIAGDRLRQRLGRVDPALALRMGGESGHGDGIDESNHVGRDFPSRPEDQTGNSAEGVQPLRERAVHDATAVQIAAKQRHDMGE
ncbi:hypothetical protein RI054_04g20400 [Pseudoscourfieldia marina]